MKKSTIFFLSFVFALTSLTQAQDLEANKKLHQRLCNEIWNQKALNVVEEIYSSDWIGHSNPPAGTDLVGYPGLYKNFNDRFVGFPDIQYAIDDQVAEGDMVVSRTTAMGTHQGVFNGIPPTGKQVVMQGVIWSRIADGKIVESWNNADELGVMQQLGLMPAPATLTDYHWAYTRQAGNGWPQDPVYNKSILGRLFNEVWNQNNLNVVNEIFHPEYYNIEFHKQFFIENLTGFPDMKFTILDQIAEKDMVAIRAICFGTHQGVFRGIPPTNRKATMTYISMTRMEDGKIAQGWDCFDQLSVLQTITAASVEDWVVQN